MGHTVNGFVSFVLYKRIAYRRDLCVERPCPFYGSSAAGFCEQ